MTKHSVKKLTYKRLSSRQQPIRSCNSAKICGVSSQSETRKFNKALYSAKSKVELREEVKQQKELESRLKNDIQQSDQEQMLRDGAHDTSKMILWPQYEKDKRLNIDREKNIPPARRDFLCHKKPVYVPCAESIFDNQELIHPVLQVKKPAVRKRRRCRRKKLELISVPQMSNSAEQIARETAYPNNLLEHEIAVRNLRKKLELISVPQMSNSAERIARETAYSNNLLEHEIAVRNLRKKILQTLFNALKKPQTRNLDHRIVNTRQRRNSVSKSIQRERKNSFSSQVEFTLKYVLNDDMAITNTPQYKKEPLIAANENDESQAINQMILFTDAFPTRDNDTRSFQASSQHKVTAEEISEIPQLKTIYTSPFFLINTQNKQQQAEDLQNYDGSSVDYESQRESVHKIWQQFEPKRAERSRSAQKLNFRTFGSQTMVVKTQSHKMVPDSMKYPPMDYMKQYLPDLQIQRRFTVSSQVSKETPQNSSRKMPIEHSSTASLCDQRYAHWNEIFLKQNELYHEPLTNDRASEFAQSMKDGALVTSKSLFSFPMLDESQMNKSGKKQVKMESDVKKRRSSSSSLRKVEAPLLNNKNTAYAEYLKVSQLFTTQNSLRAVSCSKSQSHSRVRRTSMQRRAARQQSKSVVRSCSGSPMAKGSRGILRNHNRGGLPRFSMNKNQSERKLYSKN